MRLKSEGGFSTCYDYKVLDDLHDRSDNLKNFRICSSPWSPRPSLPIYYDLPTFDGSSASFTKRRSQFWG